MCIFFGLGIFGKFASGLWNCSNVSNMQQFFPMNFLLKNDLFRVNRNFWPVSGIYPEFRCDWHVEFSSNHKTRKTNENFSKNTFRNLHRHIFASRIQFNLNYLYLQVHAKNQGISQIIENKSITTCHVLIDLFQLVENCLLSRWNQINDPCKEKILVCILILPRYEYPTRYLHYKKSLGWWEAGNMNGKRDLFKLLSKGFPVDSGSSKVYVIHLKGLFIRLLCLP